MRNEEVTIYLPYKIISNLSAEQIEQWNRYYTVSPSGFDRTSEEGLWRRTQEEGTKSQSGWKSAADQRRRMVHYKHSFDLHTNEDKTVDLVLKSLYLWIHYCFPKDEIELYKSDIYSGLESAGWNKDLSIPDHFSKDGLGLSITYPLFRDEDRARGRVFSPDYSMMELLFTSEGYVVDEELRKHPWFVLDSGLRKKDVRAQAELVTDETVDKIIDLFPAQVELGCGSSIEANIPPLGFLHSVYFVSNRETHQFILGHTQDRLAYNLITRTDETLAVFTTMFRQCFCAQPTPFYTILKQLHSAGYIVGDIITNNFDGLPTRLGMTEVNVRRYDEVHIVPKINFNSRARSLLVVGNHADRRKVEASARMQGLPVIYIDPEGFYTDAGFMPYPLESPQQGDLLYRKTAATAFQKIADRMKERGLL